MATSPKTHLRQQRHLSLYYFEQYLPAFTRELSEQGFTPITIQSYIDSVAHFGTWLKKKNIKLGDITRDVVSQFGRHRCYCPGGRKKRALSGKYIKRVQRFVIFLEQQELITCQSVEAPETRPQLMLDFRKSLLLKGLSSSTLYNYEHSLSQLLPLLGDNPKAYTAKTVRDAIYHVSQGRCPAAARQFTTSLRTYLRFLHVEGLCHSNLHCAIPTVAQWSLSSMPRYITSEDIKRVIDSCDTDTKKGLRDRAIILLLARLGLRAGDIISMKFGDINWPEATLLVKGKGNRESLLPLPQEVGDAILAYISKARPEVSVEEVFLCLNAPYRPFKKSSGISSIVDAALTRARISNPPTRGAHLLRHSAATDMLRSGASLETVSTILRHRSLDMTAYYAKVDNSMLMKIAQPWPEH